MTAYWCFLAFVVFCFDGSNAISQIDLQNVTTQNNIVTKHLASLSSAVSFPWERLLQSAPLSIFLLGQLVVIAAKRDFPLHMRVNVVYKHLRHTSFRPALIHVSNEGWEAFNEAHGNMDKIRMHMALIPTNVRSALRIMGGRGTPAQIGRYVRVPLSALGHSADEGVRLSQATYDKFYHVQQLLNEFSEVLAATKGESEEELRRKRADIDEAELARNLTEERKAKVKAKYEKVNAEMVKAKERFESALADVPTGLKAILINIVSGFADVYTYGRYSASKRQSESGTYSPPVATATEDTSVDDLMLLDKAERIQIELGKLLDNFDPHGNVTIEHLAALSRGLPEISRLISDKQSSKLFSSIQQLVDECITTVNNLRSNLNSRDGSLNRHKNNGQQLLQTAQSFVAMKSKINTGNPTVRSNRAEGTSMSNERFKAVMAQQELADVRREHSKMFDRLQAEDERLQAIMLKLSRAQLEQINFKQILEILSEAIGAVSQLKERWGELVLFFQKIASVVQVVIGPGVKSFLQYANIAIEASDFEYLMVQQKRQISETAVSVGQAANFLQTVSSVYVNVSNTHLMGRLASLSGLLTVQDPTQQQVKLTELEQQSRVVQGEIRNVCLAHKREFEGQLEQEGRRILEIFVTVGPPTVKELAAVNRGEELQNEYEM